MCSVVSLKRFKTLLKKHILLNLRPVKNNSLRTFQNGKKVIYKRMLIIKKFTEHLFVAEAASTDFRSTIRVEYVYI